MNLVTGVLSQTPGSYIQSCGVFASFGWLKVNCVFSNDTVTGIQVLAQSTEMVDFSILHANQSSGSQTTVTVQLERTGMHQVFVFPILGESGILGTSAEYTQQVMVPSQGMTTADGIRIASTSISQGM